jgi:hypothetical protein
MPKVSVVVASTRDSATLGRFLALLMPTCTARSIEIVVARACPPEEYRDLAAAWPSVLFMPAQDNATVRQLRVAGLSAAEGDIVTLIEDTTLPDEAWLADLPPAATPDPVAS